MKKNLFFSLSCLCILGLFGNTIIEASANKGPKKLEQRQLAGILDALKYGHPKTVNEVLRLNGEGDIILSEQYEKDEKFQKTLKLIKQDEKKREKITKQLQAEKETRRQDPPRQKEEPENNGTEKETSFEDIEDQRLFFGDKELSYKDILDGELEGVEGITEEQQEDALAEIKKIKEKLKLSKECVKKLDICEEKIKNLKIIEKKNNTNNSSNAPKLKTQEVKNGIELVIGGKEVKASNVKRTDKFKNEQERATAIKIVAEALKTVGERPDAYEEGCGDELKTLKRLLEGLQIEKEEHAEESYMDELFGMEKREKRNELAPTANIKPDNKTLRFDLAEQWFKSLKIQREDEFKDEEQKKQMVLICALVENCEVSKEEDNSLENIVNGMLNFSQFLEFEKAEAVTFGDDIYKNGEGSERNAIMEIALKAGLNEETENNIIEKIMGRYNELYEGEDLQFVDGIDLSKCNTPNEIVEQVRNVAKKQKQ